MTNNKVNMVSYIKKYLEPTSFMLKKPINLISSRKNNKPIYFKTRYIFIYNNKLYALNYINNSEPLALESIENIHKVYNHIKKYGIFTL